MKKLILILSVLFSMNAMAQNDTTTHIKVFPNPISRNWSITPNAFNLTIAWDSLAPFLKPKLSIYIVDVLGKVIFKKEKNPNDFKYEIKFDFPSGM